MKGRIVIRYVMHLHLLLIHGQIDGTTVLASDVHRRLIPRPNLIVYVGELLRGGRVGRARGVHRYCYRIVGVALQLLFLAHRYLIVVVGQHNRVGAVFPLIGHRNIHHQTYLPLQCARVCPAVRIDISRHRNGRFRPVKISGIAERWGSQICVSVNSRQYRSRVRHVAQIIARYCRSDALVERHLVAFVDGDQYFCGCTAEHYLQLRVVA